MIRLALVALSICIGFSACGGGSEDDDDEFLARVVRITADDDTLLATDSTILRFGFSYSANEVFGDGENVVVVVRLPRELRYREGTAEIQSAVGSDEDVGAEIFDCTSGEQFLVFDLDDNDLDQAENPSGDSDAELSLTVDAVASGPGALVQAQARENTAFFGCGQVFAADAQIAIGVF